MALYDFLHSDEIFKVLLDKNVREVYFRNTLWEMKEIKNKLHNLSYENLELLRANIDSKIINASDFAPFSVLISTLLGFTFGGLTQISEDGAIDIIGILMPVGIAIVILLIIRFAISRFMRNRENLVFLKEIIDICIEEKRSNINTNQMYGKR